MEKLRKISFSISIEIESVDDVMEHIMSVKDLFIEPIAAKCIELSSTKIDFKRIELQTQFDDTCPFYFKDCGIEITSRFDVEHCGKFLVFDVIVFEIEHINAPYCNSNSNGLIEFK
jgi:hypothetical protein